VQIVVEAQSVGAQDVVECLFAGMPERGMADVMRQCERLDEFRIESEGVRKGAGDLGYFQRVSEPAAEVVTWRIAGQPGEDLGFAGEAAKGARMQNSCGVAGKRSSVGMGGLGKFAARKFSTFVSCDSRGQRARRL
jgi:hypothetical protein